MRRFLLIAGFFFLAIPCWSQTCSNTVVGSFTCVRNATNNTASNASSVTYAGGYTAGQLILVGVIENNGNAWAAGNVTNTNGYTWHFWGDVLSAPTPQHTAFYYTTVPSTTSTSDTITATNSSGTLTIIDSAIYSGSGVLGIDGPGVSNTGNSANLSSGAYTVTTGDLNVGFGVAGAGAVTVGAGWNNRENETGLGGGPYSMLEDQSAASSSATATFTATSGNWGVIAVAFRSFAANTGGQFISGPLLPQATPSASYPSEGPYTITAVASGANLQTAITAAGCGTVLDLATNGSWSTASAYTLPNTSCACHTDPTKWVIIRSHAFVGGSVRGARVDPSAEYSSLAHITSSDASTTFKVTASGAGCYWFLGIDATETTNNATAVLSLGDGSFSIANYPHDFVIDHCYIHGLPALGLQRGAMINNNWTAIVDSYFSDAHELGVDSQAVAAWDGLGYWLLQNNFLEGAGENVLFGGAGPQIGDWPSDLTVIGNHFFKPLSWRQQDPTYEGIGESASHWDIKNNFELKDMNRAYLTKNVFENDWLANQGGTIILMNVSCNTNSPIQSVGDVTATLNIVRHGVAGLAIGNCGTSPVNLPFHRALFTNNLYYDLDARLWGDTISGSSPSMSLSGIPLGALYSPFDMWLVHETVASGTTNIQTNGFALNNTPSEVNYGIQFRNSIIDEGLFGVPNAVSVGCCDTSITYMPGSNWNNDCMYGVDSGTYVNAAFTGRQHVANQAAIFVNPGVDFHVSASSACHLAASDGLDMGANIDAVNAATANTVKTLTNLHTVTNVSPSTFTHAGGTSVTITGSNFIVGTGNAGESGLGVIFGGAGPTSAISTITCAVDTCTVVMSAPITLAVSDTVNVQGGTITDNNLFAVASVTDTMHFTYTDTGIGARSWSGGTANRVSPGNACTSVSVVSSTSITCVTPAASGTVTTGPVSIFVSQFGIPVQSTVFGNYN